MADHQPQVSSIKSRIAALNLEEVHAPKPGIKPSYSYEHAAAKKKPPPPPPTNRPSVQGRQQTVNNPPIVNHLSPAGRPIGNQPVEHHADTPRISPALPPRPPPRNNPPPSLPERKNSDQMLKRRDSLESISTIASGTSSLSLGSSMTSVSGGFRDEIYRVRAPAYDPSKLPPLPAKKEPDEPKLSATRSAMKSKSTLTTASRALPPQLSQAIPPPPPARSATQPLRTTPPPLPNRPTLPPRDAPKSQENVAPQPPKRANVVRPSALSWGLNKSTETPPPLPASRPTESAPPVANGPPPIPMGSRPNLAAIMASKPKPSALNTCLRCRDFSGPDSHAAKFPRQNLQSSDIAWLAHQLTSPFPSATDKARVIFTWLHHNIEYDVQAFFNNNVQRRTPENTLTSGLAVCEGYAGLFAALALKSGLEAVVVGGNGKGFGHSPLKPGEPVPKFSCGHAWNAVRIDNGEWKLIDPCWGAGVVNGPGQPYSKRFNPAMFTMDNNEFGWKHFPEDSKYFFRTDGRPTISWEEYCLDDVPERLQVYGPATPEHNIGERSFQPERKQIKVHDPQNPTVRFQFATVCPHWDHERNGKGKPYVMVLNYGETEWTAFETDGRVWWLDIKRSDLGAPGQKVSVFSVDKIEGKDARGVSVDEYRRKIGRVGMGPFGGVAMWELV
ncbi:hypothetical protein BU24DRAFT_226750 [Aaosphaeria arxii CBS 175.79]|uniref:Transglutaminase-like domain-containing protein n=1 Tax=Aaosphaeria arxii CBS 175.79 TaxID=1450172 RepID=A0A6A5XRX5_9PLEO|nr:uncharacterized protein BU24DRAFT_226750 [Aaosphaeria arxii CBS 175.79]KAF2015014.1 hypothetical protein BU24DRAFT_226750 [Aaosphaeria arxii CBS 175.79]